MPISSLRRCLLAAALLLGLLPQFAAAESRIASYGMPGAFDVQVNPVTNKVYVGTGSGVWVIDAASNAVSTIAPGVAIGRIAVNPASNTIFALAAAGNVLVIDGAAGTFVQVPGSATPRDIAVNPVTNEAYVTSSSGLTVIDGNSKASTSPAVGPIPGPVAVNAITNKAYVASAGSVFVIDGATKAATPFATGTSNYALALNPVTNKVYVFSDSGGGLLEIDGATGASVAIPLGGVGGPIAVNPVNNKIYVAYVGTFIDYGGEVIIVDGATRVATTISSLVANPAGFAVNPVTNTIYVRGLGRGANDIMAIDGATNAARRFDIGPRLTFATGQAGMAVNPVTNTLYVSQTLLGVDAVDASVNVASSIAMPPGPPRQRLLAANPVTEKIYVADVVGNTVTVIDEATATTTDVVVGVNPRALAVNPATDRIYVGNSGSVTVSVIDGPTNAVTTVPVADPPTAIAVNMVTNKVYVGGSYSLTVIDGATNATTTIPLAVAPTGFPGAAAVVINQATNRIYALSPESGAMTVVDGNTLSTTAIGIGPSAAALAVNDVTNKIYVANRNVSNPLGGNTLTVIDGATLTRTNLSLPFPPMFLAVNPITNKLYVVSAFAGGFVDVIDGVTHARTGVIWMNGPSGIEVDAVANKIYLADVAYQVKVIDGATNVTSELPAGRASSIVFNPVSGRLYVADLETNAITVVRPSVQTLANHDTDVVAMAGNVTSLTALSLSVCCPYAPNDPPVRTVNFRTGDARGAFAQAFGSGPFIANLDGLRPGLNFVTFFASDAMQGTSFQSGSVSSSMIGAPRVFPLVYAPPGFATLTPLPPVLVGGAYNQAIPVTGGIGPLTFAVTEGGLPPGMTLSPSGVLSGTPTMAGFFVFTLVVFDTSGANRSAVFALTVTTTNGPRLGNISTRAQSLGGEDVLIGGFVIGGSINKTVVVRARGPSLIPFGVSNALANPTLQLIRSSDQATIASNDDWGTAANAAVLTASGFAPTNSLESAVLVNLPPGAYTAIVAGAAGGTGVAIVEVFELDFPEAPLANISTRGRVGVGTDAMIGGFVIQGNAPQTVVVRARGPSLAAAGVSGTLANPSLRLVRSSDQAIIAENDNWIGAPNAQAIRDSGFAPGVLLESAILVTLDPGAYTAIVSGVGGTAGVGIVEVFVTP